ncbi:MAG: alcohol dehydrogenase catalytic domain-containing protein [Solirubrobacterales bacterium]
MKAVLLPGDRAVEVVDRPRPTVGPGEVVVRVRSSAICASDLSLYYGDALVGGENAGSGAIVPGHEAAGDVIEVGDGTRFIGVGDRVAVHLSIGCMHCEHCLAGYIHHCAEWRCVGFDVDGGDAEYIVVPEINCLRLPDQLSYEAGSLIVDNFGTQYHAQKRLEISGVGRTAIVGIGPMGSSAILTAKARGARVIAVDVLDHRLELAERLGADWVVDASDGNALDEIMRISNGRGVERAIDCSGNPSGETLVLEAAAKLGKVAFVGECSRVEVNPSEQFIRKELEVYGAWVFPIFEFDEVTRFLIEARVPIESTVSDRCGIDDAPQAFDRFDKRLTEKVMFVWE